MNPSENLNIKDITEVGIWVRLNRIHMLHEGNQSVADWRMLKGVHAGKKTKPKKTCLSSSSNYLRSLRGDWHIVEREGKLRRMEANRMVSLRCLRFVSSVNVNRSGLQPQFAP